ncbi:MAG: type II secretion system protein [Sulfurimonas sp.]|nr:type II secretion system protein [Sulfurimonas sp.]
MKKAFTMIELIFVLVVVGILAAVILPRTKTNPLQEAAIQLLSHIRYTQHLALVDDVYDANDANWYKKMADGIYKIY